MICKIEGLRGSGSDNHFIDEVLERFKEESMELQKKKTVEEMREQQGKYANAIDELRNQNHQSIEEKNEEIDHLRNNVQVVFIGHGKENNGDFGDQIMMANMESLKELDSVVYVSAVKMLNK